MAGGGVAVTHPSTMLTVEFGVFLTVSQAVPLRVIDPLLLPGVKVQPFVGSEKIGVPLMVTLTFEGLTVPASFAFNWKVHDESWPRMALRAFSKAVCVAVEEPEGLTSK